MTGTVISLRELSNKLTRRLAGIDLGDTFVWEGPWQVLGVHYMQVNNLRVRGKMDPRDQWELTELMGVLSG